MAPFVFWYLKQFGRIYAVMDSALKLKEILVKNIKQTNKNGGSKAAVQNKTLQIGNILSYERSAPNSSEK